MTRHRKNKTDQNDETSQNRTPGDPRIEPKGDPGERFLKKASFKASQEASFRSYMRLLTEASSEASQGGLFHQICNKNSQK